MPGWAQWDLPPEPYGASAERGRVGSDDVTAQNTPAGVRPCCTPASFGVAWPGGGREGGPPWPSAKLLSHTCAVHFVRAKADTALLLLLPRPLKQKARG